MMGTLRFAHRILPWQSTLFSLSPELLKDEADNG
jgi:hypothetical protein